MTVAAKNNLKIFAPYLAFLPVVYMLVAWGRFIEKSESRMFKDAHQKEEVISHTTKGTDAYLNVHMELDKKDNRYVKKGELKNLQEDVTETKDAVKIIQKDIKEILKNQ